MIKRFGTILGCAFLVSMAAQAAPVRIAAIVNDEVITTTDITDRRDFILATSDIPPTPEAQAKLTPRILDALINETLELQEAKRLSIDISDEEIEKAIGQLEAARNRPPGSLRTFIKEKNLSARSLETQLRAQLAWNKVVSRKLRRSVNIAQDEVTRAQLAQASAPGVTELQIAAISLPIKKPEDEQTAAEMAKNVSEQLNAGADFLIIAQELDGSGKAQLSAPIWVPEESLQPAMQQALRTLKPGQVTQPLRSQNTYQLINLMNRRVSKPTPDETEVVVKQLTIPLPPKKEKASLEMTRETIRALRTSPGNCIDTDLGAQTGKAEVTYMRARYNQMTPDLRSVIEHLNVTEVSQPLLTDKTVLLVMPCERIEPATALPDAKKVRAALFSEKLELEAQKYLRNLRRDAFIDIKGE